MELLLENISEEELKKYIKEFYNYAIDNLKINKTPKLFLKHSKKNAEDMFGKTGFYNPSEMSIHLFVTDRHPKDILRSFAHELIHHEQQCLGKNKTVDLSKTAKDPAYATNDPKLREMEREAFERGNLLFRDWCDMKKLQRNKIMENKKQKEEVPFKDLFSKKERALNEVKTNHENDLYNELMKRYIPKEEKKDGN